MESGFYVKNLLLYAEDPDDGEVPFTCLVLENEPEWIRPSSATVGKLATFDIIAAVGDVDNVTATIDPDALVTRDLVQQFIAEHNADPDAHPDIIRAIMMGEVTANLTAQDGLGIITRDGMAIVAVKKL